ncbi:PIR Superfamily Protein [Plasmodium malariae]|uniref:PIR Superfamily Protein n=1 Tax=Plasmodium malariae TaxID=5858 RepID=A0A1A8WTN1_PLAMA|nr:PIR Superfamily Protein [Plasmodium malariae]
MSTSTVALESILKELPEYKQYDDLFKSKQNNVSLPYCNNDNSEWKNEDVKKVCNNIIDYLKKFDNTKKKKNINYDECAYFTYWIYDKIISELGTKGNKIIHPDDRTKLNHAILSAYKKKVEKDCTFYFDGNFNEWKEEKHLYYYFKSYDHIRNKKHSSGTEKKKYCDYLEQIKNIYEKHIRKCCKYFFLEKNNDNICKNYIKCEEQYNPYYILSELKCKHNLSSDYWEKLIQELIIDRDVLILSQHSSKRTLINFLDDPFYKAITFGFVTIGLLFTLFLFYKTYHYRKNKNKEIFLDQNELLERFYYAKHRRLNLEDRDIHLSYDAI